MDEQEKALRSLKRAFKRCSRAGLSFVGMDDNLLYFDAAELREATENNQKSIYDGMVELGQGGHVKTSGAYIDSGGW